jgi:hypothetical protein
MAAVAAAAEALAARSDVFIDLPALSRALIYSDPSLVGTAPPLSKAASEDENAYLLAQMMLGTAAEFGSPTLTMHALEIMQHFGSAVGGSSGGGESMDTQRLAALAMSQSYAREQDWRLRACGGVAASMHQTRTVYWPRITADRQAAAAAAAAAKTASKRS